MWCRNVRKTKTFPNSDQILSARPAVVSGLPATERNIKWNKRSNVQQFWKISSYVHFKNIYRIPNVYQICFLFKPCSFSTRIFECSSSIVVFGKTVTKHVPESGFCHLSSSVVWVRSCKDLSHWTGSSDLLGKFKTHRLRYQMGTLQTSKWNCMISFT